MEIETRIYTPNEKGSSTIFELYPPLAHNSLCSVPIRSGSVHPISPFRRCKFCDAAQVVLKKCADKKSQVFLFDFLLFLVFSKEKERRKNSMGVIERASSSSPRRKDKQNPSCQKDGHGLFREKIIRKVRSFSSAFPSSKKEEEEKDKENKQSMKEGKLIRRAKSFSSSLEKEKKGSPDLQKVKLIRRVSSLSSSSLKKKESPDLQKGKLIRRVSSLSSSSIKKEKPISTQKNSSSFKSRLRESGPICKRRKETLAEVAVKFQLEENDDDVNISLDKQIEEEGKENFWLSSGIMSPQDFGFFMSSLDPSLDELVLVKEPISSF